MTLPSDADLIRAYLDDALPDAQRDAFELRLLVEPALQDQADLELALRRGMQAHRADIVRQQPVAVAQQASPRRSRHPAFALAASFVAGAILPTLLWLNAQQSSTGPTDADFAPVGNVPALLVDQVRSANTDVVLRVAPGAPMLLLQVPVYPQHPDERYSLRIDREDGTAVTELDQLVPDGNETITALVPAARMPVGRYRLELKSAHDGVTGEKRRMTLRVMATT